MRKRVLWILLLPVVVGVCMNCSNLPQKWEKEVRTCLSTSDSVSFDLKSISLKSIKNQLAEANSISNQLDVLIEATDTLTLELALPMDQFVSALKNGNELDIEFQDCQSANMEANKRLRLLLADLESGSFDHAVIPSMIQQERKEVATLRAHSVQILVNFKALNEAIEQFKPFIQRYSNSIVYP